LVLIIRASLLRGVMTHLSIRSQYQDSPADRQCRLRQGAEEDDVQWPALRILPVHNYELAGYGPACRAYLLAGDTAPLCGEGTEALKCPEASAVLMCVGVLPSKVGVDLLIIHSSSITKIDLSEVLLEPCTCHLPLFFRSLGATLLPVW